MGPDKTTATPAEAPATRPPRPAAEPVTRQVVAGRQVPLAPGEDGRLHGDASGLGLSMAGVPVTEVVEDGTGVWAAGPVQAPFLRGEARFALSPEGEPTGEVAMTATVEVLGVPLAAVSLTGVTAEPLPPAENEPQPPAPVPAGNRPQTSAPVPAEPVASGVPVPSPDVPLHIPPAPAEPSPAHRERLAAVSGGAAMAAASASDLPDGKATAEAARAAVTEPPAETSARAGAALTEALGRRPEPSPAILELCDAIRRAIRSKRPVDQDRLVKADPHAMAKEAGGSLNAAVQGDAARVAGGYDALRQDPAGVPAQTPEPMPSLPVAVPDPGIDAQRAVPDPIPAENVSLAADQADLDRRIAESRIERPSTEPIQDGPFGEVRQGRRELGELAASRPSEVLAAQDEALAQARTGMADLQARALAALAGTRSSTVTDLTAGRHAMVGGEERTRQAVGRRAQAIFDDAQTRVGALLDPLTRTAMATWTAGVERHSTEFRRSLDRVAAWIEERHSGALGALAEGWDALTGLPGWVTEEYDRAETLFGDRVCALLLEISTDVESVIAAAQAIIEDARRRIAELFDALPAELREWAAGEQAAFTARLDGLQSRVAATRDGFTRNITEQAVTAVTRVRREVEQLREAAGGLIGRVVGAIEEFLDDPIRVIIDTLLNLAGIPPASFWALVDRVQQVVADIAEDPRRFAGNLVAALGQGFQGFFDRFGEHLTDGFFQWLLRGLGSAGVQSPADFSVPSIITFALQLMGLTWARIREILVRHVGERNVELVEQAWELVSALIRQGPAGVLEMLRERLDPAALFDQILDAAVSYVTETLVEQAAVRILGMLNPAGAVLQAIELIYKVLRWVFENAASVFRLVETVVNGAADLMAGNIGGMATAVELALAATVPIVIDLLAGLVGLGDLPERVVDVIRRMQSHVLGIVEKVIVWLVERGRALLTSLGLGGREQEKQENRPGGETAGDTEPGTTVRFGAGGETHRHWVEVTGADAELMVASVPMRVRDKLDSWEEALQHARTPQIEAEVRRLIAAARALLGATEPLAVSVAGAYETALRLSPRPGEPKRPLALDDDTLEDRQRALSRILGALFELFGETGSEEATLVEIAAQLPIHARGEWPGIERNWWDGQIAKSFLGEGAERMPVWNNPHLVGGALSAGLAHLGEDAVHQALLPYFQVSAAAARRSPRTAAFGTYALVARSPDPPHQVRRTFLETMAEDVRRELVLQGQRGAPAEDEDLRTRLNEIGYHHSMPPYGRFQPLPGLGYLHPLVYEAVRRLGVDVFFEQLVAGTAPVGWESFQKIMAERGRTRQWINQRFRGLSKGAHEWIPTNYIDRVLAHAIDVAGRGDMTNALNWVRLQNRVRSPTNHVICRTFQVTRVETIPPTTVRHIVTPVVRGHVGFVERGTPYATVGTARFHDRLRELFTEYVRDSPGDYVQALLAALPQLIWNGELPAEFPPEELDLPLPARFRIDDETFAQLTIRQAQARQRAVFTELSGQLQAILDQLGQGGSL